MKEFIQLSLPYITGKEQKSYFEELLRILKVSDDTPGWTDAFGNALRKWVQSKLHTPVKTLSLFSGGGGLDIAFHDAGFDIIQMVEVNSRYVETLIANSKEGRRLHGGQAVCTDIKDFSLPRELSIDFVIGGPPCQTFSAAGRRAAGVSGLDDPRGNLFKEYVKVLDTLQPKGFLFENVYGIVGAQGGKPWQKILEAFRAVGYNVSYRILDAADYGIPQHRERLIVVGTRDREFLFPRPTHGPDSSDTRPYYTSGLAVQGLADNIPGPIGGRYGYMLKDIPPGLNYSFYTEEMGHPSPLFAWRSKFSDFLYKADPDAPVRTIKASGGQYTGPFHWNNRPFSISELKRLQTFPDDYTLIGGRQVAIEQIGNSVPPQFGRLLAIAVLQQLFALSLPLEIDYLSLQEELGFRTRKKLLTSLYKKKAQEAIAKLSPSVVENDSEKNQLVNSFSKEEHKEGIPSILGYLGSDFFWCIQGDCKQDYPWNVEFSIQKNERSWELFVGEVGNLFSIPAMTIKIAPLNKWGIPTKVVKLHIESLSTHLYTAAWKAFEYHIATEGIKADLVQLNGYYQYKPQLILEVQKLEIYSLKRSLSEKWIVIKNIVEDRGVRRIIALTELAHIWNLPIKKVIKLLMEIRCIGYEVRSEYTNSQIPQEHVLIPYSFPTLNPRSVQLRKTLFPVKTLS